MKRVSHIITRSTFCFAALLGSWLDFFSHVAAEEVGTAPRIHVISPVSTEAAVHEVRSVLSTLNDANRSGNYSVLRDLAASEFKDEHSVDDLGRAFARLRESGTELSFVNRTAPEFNSSSLIESDGSMKLEGRFRGPAEDLEFAMTFVEQEGRWRLRTLDVSTKVSQRSAYIKSVPAPSSPSASRTVPSVIKQSNVIVHSVPMSAPSKVAAPESTHIETGALRQLVAGPHTANPDGGVQPSPDVAVTERRSTWGIKLGPSVNALGDK
jgi:hypothetical protein